MKLIKYTRVLILGSGPSGYTSSIYIFRSNLNPILLTGNSFGGQLMKTEFLENWPAEIKIKGIDLMDKFFNQIKFINLELNFDNIYNVNYLVKPNINFGNLFNYLSDLIIISTGSKPKYLSLISENKFLNKGISFCALCDGNLYKNKTVAVIGGGNSALENIIYLFNIVKKIFIIHRKKLFSADNILIKSLLNIKLYNKKNIIFKLNFNCIELIGDNYTLKYIKIINKINKIINILFINGLFISIGNNPNSNKFKGQLKFNSDKYIFTKLSTNTSLNGIFCSGDIHNYIYKQAIISSSLGCISALDLISYYKNLIIYV